MSSRFGDDVAIPAGIDGALFASMARRGSCRAYKTDRVDDSLIEFLAGVALAAPSKSDLQQRDILIVRDPELRRRIDGLMPDFEWLPEAPVLLLFLANNARQRRLHEMTGEPFANDHLDAFFNAGVDAAISLATFVTAAEAAGLGVCPLSVIRNHCKTVAEWCALPDHVFPVAALAVGWPASPPKVSMRLPLAETVHVDRFSDDGSVERIEAYGTRRRVADGSDEPWQLQKAKMYAKLQRGDFGAYVRSIGFTLE